MKTTVFCGSGAALIDFGGTLTELRSGSEQFISSEIVEEAASDRREAEHGLHDRVMGVDVARFGDDARIHARQAQGQFLKSSHPQGEGVNRASGPSLQGWPFFH